MLFLLLLLPLLLLAGSVRITVVTRWFCWHYCCYSMVLLALLLLLAGYVGITDKLPSLVPLLHRTSSCIYIYVEIIDALNMTKKKSFFFFAQMEIQFATCCPIFSTLILLADTFQFAYWQQDGACWRVAFIQLLSALTGYKYVMKVISTTVFTVMTIVMWPQWCVDLRKAVWCARLSLHFWWKNFFFLDFCLFSFFTATLDEELGVYIRTWCDQGLAVAASEGGLWLYSRGLGC